MFHSLLKSKFFNRCKTDLKLTRTRIEMIKRRRNAVQKYLKSDIVDRLKNGLDNNAFAKAEELIVEMDKSKGYDMIDQYCEHVGTHLAAIDKQRECPEDCREAISSLMYAAARIADLPELRQLRRHFSDRYGNSLDPYVGKQFAEKLKPGHPTKDEKLRLLQEIAAEHSLDWSSKALENNLFNESIKKRGKESESNDSTRAEFNHNKNVDSSRDVPSFRDIPVDITGRVAGRNEDRKDKPLMYGSVPAPYTKGEANKKPNQGKSHESFEEIKIESLAKPKAKSVRTRGTRPLLHQSSSGGSESDENGSSGRAAFKFLDENRGEKLNYNGKEGPQRTSSLPAETSSSPDRDMLPRHVRSVSYHQGNNNNNNVHPRPPPDYDDVVTRLAALRREEKH